MALLTTKNYGSRLAMANRRGGFNPLSLDPYLALDFLLPGNQSRALKTGGTQAAYLDLVPTWENPGTASDATQGTSGSQPVFLAHETGANYLHLPGLVGNNASAAVSTNPSGDLDLRVLCEAANWTSSDDRIVIAKQSATDSAPSYSLGFNADNTLRFISFGGASFRNFASTVVPALNNSVKYWLRATLVPATGVVTFYTSTDGVSWSQVGATLGSTPFTPDHSTVEPLRIGRYSNVDSIQFRGAVYRARLLDGIGGSDVFDINFAAVPHGATSFVCTTGQTVTINSTGNNPATVIGKPVLRYDGVDDFLSGTFAAAITGGRMFAIFRVLGNGGTTFGRVFVADNNITDNDPVSVTFTTKNGGNLFGYNNPDFLYTHVGAFAGRLLHEALVAPGTQISRINNASEIVAAFGCGAIASTHHRVGAGVFGGDAAAIDLEALYLLPAATSAANVAKMRVWLNDTHDLGLTLP